MNSLLPAEERANTLPEHLASLLLAIVAGEIYKDVAFPPDLRDLRNLALITEKPEKARTRIAATMYGEEVARLLAEPPSPTLS